MNVGNLEDKIDENHAIVSSSVGPEYYVNVLSFVDKDQLELSCAILMHNKVFFSFYLVHITFEKEQWWPDMFARTFLFLPFCCCNCAGSCPHDGQPKRLGAMESRLLQDEVDPMVSVMKVEKASLESYADIRGLDSQIQEIKEAVELPLTHPELYEDIGIKPPKGVILYGEPGTGKTLLAKAVANSTLATFLRVVGSELIQKYDAHSGGEREIQRTMLELLNQLDGFDARADVKVIFATNRIESLDLALLRPLGLACV
ncbi:unnamed protein product [Sphagnum troendelagicum]|uniref:AAA+ ATPase domain-containing protein n=1 Tax=Sphagnum troendelagicum TaxID=128251 RepID=A0ABP0UUS8_9BRYO